eukprot:TRINITY_DN6266_c0_g1_i20.p1 TRINITY_DN6266_c0_g1~~TRINITY_DN6266_c0_g1_i20.p1  ORF type:complete len:219 (-),score=60.28 TRINITY_DN6266_c0_g1_i20:301-867(-)
MESAIGNDLLCQSGDRAAVSTANAEQKEKRNTFRKKEPKSTKPSKPKVSSKVSSISMQVSDWNKLLEGAVLFHFQKDEYIIREGQKHQRIYQIASGSCEVVVDKGSGQRKHLVTLLPNALMGEMTFLDPANQKATASVIAENDDCSVYIIEGHFIHMLMVDDPHLGGRFYSYLCSILAKRHSDRELQK